MFPVSKKFKESIYSTIRTVKARVTFDITDIEVRKSKKTITTTTEKSVISNKDQLVNGKRDLSYKLITCENNRTKLDGSFSFISDTKENLGELGFVSMEMCNSTGVFDDTPVIQINFDTTISLMGLTVTFDKQNSEYAKVFTINAYKGNVLVTTVDINNNFNTSCEVIGQFLEFDNLIITVKEWNTGYRYCRMLEIDFGIIRVYEDGNLIKANLIEECDIINSQIALPEFSFTIDNSNKEFNVLNPNGFYRYLQEMQKVQFDLGVDIGNDIYEYIALGDYYLKDWVSEEGAMTTTFICRSILDNLDMVEYENTEAKSGYNLYILASDILELCNIKEYQIDETLKNISTKGLIKKAKCRNIMQMLCIAGCCNMYLDRSNNVIIKSNIEQDYKESIELSQMYSQPKIELSSQIKTFEVAYYDNFDSKTSIIVNDLSIKQGGNVKVENTLINSSARATTVANWLKDRYKNRATYNVSWRGNPSIELLDNVLIQNIYSDDMKAYITKNELTYQGFLKGNLTCKGGVN